MESSGGTSRVIAGAPAQQGSEEELSDGPMCSARMMRQVVLCFCGPEAMLQKVCPPKSCARPGCRYVIVFIECRRYWWPTLRSGRALSPARPWAIQNV
ncbi:hypothetical protein NDU88_006647 [Pleurodeles waltl]|uniref:Uncharacterized protein n=1 Tax=Pleurodeles waltl TaxID=8319 RepID=A0AAV7VN97_PLEWA|nr:hypothetical protein NDU88_006647 [Pleurodeles waltl]